MLGFLVPGLAAFCACAGFSLMYNLRGAYIPASAMCGAFSWAVYLIAARTGGSIMPYFFAGAAVALYSEIAAIVLRAPATVFLIPGIIPTVPGLTVYRAMAECMSHNTAGFIEKGIETFKIGGAIAAGVIVCTALFRLVRAVYQKHHKE